MFRCRAPVVVPRVAVLIHPPVAAAAAVAHKAAVQILPLAEHPAEPRRAKASSEVPVAVVVRAAALRVDPQARWARPAAVAPQAARLDRWVQQAGQLVVGLPARWVPRVVLQAAARQEVLLAAVARKAAVAQPAPWAVAVHKAAATAATRVAVADQPAAEPMARKAVVAEAAVVR
ncbi:MAG: hypothetical protein ABW171_18340 [Steroidobacter sp.]